MMTIAKLLIKFRSGLGGHDEFKRSIIWINLSWWTNETKRNGLRRSERMMAGYFDWWRKRKKCHSSHAVEKNPIKQEIRSSLAYDFISPINECHLSFSFPWRYKFAARSFGSSNGWCCTWYLVWNIALWIHYVLRKKIIHGGSSFKIYHHCTVQRCESENTKR